MCLILYLLRLIFLVMIKVDDDDDDVSTVCATSPRLKSSLSIYSVGDEHKCPRLFYCSLRPSEYGQSIIVKKMRSELTVLHNRVLELLEKIIQCDRGYAIPRSLATIKCIRLRVKLTTSISSPMHGVSVPSIADDLSSIVSVILLDTSHMCRRRNTVMINLLREFKVIRLVDDLDKISYYYV